MRVEPGFVFFVCASFAASCGSDPAADVEVVTVDGDDDDAVVDDDEDRADDVVDDEDAVVVDDEDVVDAEEEPVAEEPVEEPAAEEPVAEEPVAPADEAPAAEAAAAAAPASSGRERVRLNIATVNIGRDYGARGTMANAIDHVRGALVPKSGPLLIGWQEIGEADPCGQCEIEEVRSTFDGERFQTFRPQGHRPNGATERVHVPITLRGAGDGVTVRAPFASAPWAHVSPTRFVTVTYSPELNVAHLNTHLIAGAWSCKSQVERRRDAWRDGWRALKDAVAAEVARGRNVVVTGDLNRGRGANHCNPAWDPSTLHARARVVGGSGIDYVFAVPAQGQRFVYERHNGNVVRGNIPLGIDGHKGWWVAGHFQPN